MAAESVLELGNGLELWKAAPDDLREQDVNARSMTPDAFNRLAETIGRDNRLESLPFCAATDLGVEIVSGHHRVRAARSAGEETVWLLVDVTGLTPAEIKAKQLAHNSISGVDDPELVARIYRDIDDMEARLEAFIDETKFEPPPDPVPVPSLDLGIEYRMAVIGFLPWEEEAFKKAVDMAAETLGSSTSVYITDIERLELFRGLVGRLRRDYDARALNVVLDVLARIVSEHLGDPVEEVDAEAWTPLVELTGCALLPPDAGDVVRSAIERIRANDKDMKPWQAVEFLAAEYLAGP